MFIHFKVNPGYKNPKIFSAPCASMMISDRILVLYLAWIRNMNKQYNSKPPTTPKPLLEVLGIHQLLDCIPLFGQLILELAQVGFNRFANAVRPVAS